jgi:N-acyl-D-aspartate/D-glutamate deacylase
MHAEPLDLLIRGATLYDGTGVAPVVADVGVRDGIIVEVGQISGSAAEIIDAGGAWLTPGFIDIHTHFDGQATWDETFSPSIHHGVTTLVMGNCGVGFAPVQKGREDRLINLMSGVEDIPGSALSEGMRWGWERFPEYMDALDRMPHSLDFLCQVPHDALRMFVMGERGEARASASQADVAQMRALLREALDAGACGFSTGRSDNHRTSEGFETPAADAAAAELCGIVQAFDGLDHGVVQVVSDFDLLRGDPTDTAASRARFDLEFDLVEQVARASHRPTSMSWLQRDPGGWQYLAMQARVDAVAARGLPLYLQTAARGVGVIMGLDASFHPFMGFPAYQALAALPLAERARLMREPALKARMLAEKSARLAGDGTPIPPLVDILLAQIELIAARMFPLTQPFNYEPAVQHSFYVRAKQRGVTAMAALYDYLVEGDGGNLIYFPIFNYNAGNLDAVADMLRHPHALAGLSDSGAHVGTICDASFSTYLLTHWAEGQPHARANGTQPVQQLVAMLTQRNARYLGLTDRGMIAPGMRADMNLIDPARLACGTPTIVRDLPAGGRRFLQTGEGYIATWVAGVCVQREGEVTKARPGRLVRMGHTTGSGVTRQFAACAAPTAFS